VNFLYTSQKKFLVFLSALILSLLFIVQAAFAQGGENADSPGIPGQKPLSFISITMLDSGENVQNAADIPSSPKFKVAFDKNVVNSILWENNRKCFSLVSENNENVPLSVTKIDDTIDFAQRTNIFVQPTVSLNPGTSYTLVIAPELKAKNGVSTIGGTTSGQGIAISFKTAGEAAVQSSVESTAPTAGVVSQAPVNTSSANSANTTDKPGANDKTGSTGISDNNQPTPAAGQQSVNNPDAGNAAQVAASGEPANPAHMGGKLNWTNLLTILFVVLVVGWIGVEVLLKKR
jgi:hypothetical protein